MCPVPVVVGRIVVAVHEVPAAPVVDVAVAVVVDPVRPAAGAVLALVDPDVLGKIRMRDVDTCVDDGDGDVRAARGDGPRFLRVDVRVRGAARPVHLLARVVEAPLLREGRVVRNVGRMEDEVRLRVGDARVLLEGTDRPARVRRAYRDDGAVDLREALRRPGIDCAEHTGPPHGADVRLEADDDRAGHRSRFPGRLRTLASFLIPVPGTLHDNFALRDPLPEVGDWLHFLTCKLPARLRKKEKTP